MKVVALSHSADFGREMNLMVAIAAAMDEARDQGVPVAWPSVEGAPARIVQEHERLAADHGAQAVLTVPLTSDEGDGALTLETTSPEGFTAEHVRFVSAVGAALGSLLALRLRDDRPLPVKAWHALLRQAERLVGPGYLGRKLTAIAALVFGLFFAFAQGDYRISADGVLEGSRRRVVAAPFDGYVAESALRAGDTVAAGELLARLDDRDLRLEQLKWRSRHAQYQRQYDEARAARERAQVRILAAQIEEAEAELARIDERVARTRVEAPFDALVVSGDLTQSLGAAVARGDVLFELAPLDRYRVLLEVDEAQIGDVEVGQRGSVLLAALPAEPLGFAVTKLTPIASAEEGTNSFRVEGVLDEVSGRLRPGMEGVGKIEVGRRNLFWIWTRGVQTWIRLQLWNVWP
jgi:multidrug efflux pump subunit AcrA (membrane-fusion protein)